MFAICVLANADWELSAMENTSSKKMPPIDIDFNDETIVSAEEFPEGAMMLLRRVHRKNIVCTPVVTQSKRWGLVLRVDIKSSESNESLGRTIVWRSDPKNTQSGFVAHSGQPGEGRPLPNDEECGSNVSS